MKIRTFAAGLATACLMLSQSAAIAAPAMVQPKGPAPSGVHTDGAKNISGWAHVASDGSLLQGVNVTGAFSLGNGSYEVDFNSKLNKCAITATAYTVGTTVGVEPRSGNIRGVFVYFRDLTNTAADREFYVVVTC